MTKKQERWQRRGRLLWRLKGITGFDLSPGIVTPSEQELLTRALGLIKHVVEHSTLSSRQLGFNAKRRCSWVCCNKPTIEGSDYCLEHHQYTTSNLDNDNDEDDDCDEL